MKEDPIITMLKDKGLTEEQIQFLIHVLNEIRRDLRSDNWGGPDAVVRSVLDRFVKN